MSVSKRRKAASLKLGGEMKKRLENLVLAVGQDEIAMRAVELGQVFNDNTEFIIWVLQTYGGGNPPPPEDASKRRKRPTENPLPKTPDALLPKPSPVKMECTCEKLEPGIIGGNRHMASCPLFEG